MYLAIFIVALEQLFPFSPPPLPPTPPILTSTLNPTPLWLYPCILPFWELYNKYWYIEGSEKSSDEQNWLTFENTVFP